MKPAILIILCLFFFNIANSQTNIKLEDLKSHIGDSVTVCGKVYSVRYLESSNNTPTFLNIGAKYPDQLLTVVIWGDARKEFTGKPEDDYTNKEVCIIGKVELYKDKPQIVIRKANQLKLKE